jgi:hypothetical protein
MPRAMDTDPTRTRKWIAASGVIGFFAAVLWLGAPLVPAALGAAGAGLLLYYRTRR